MCDSCAVTGVGMEVAVAPGAGGGFKLNLAGGFKLKDAGVPLTVLAGAKPLNTRCTTTMVLSRSTSIQRVECYTLTLLLLVVAAGVLSVTRKDSISVSMIVAPAGISYHSYLVSSTLEQASQERMPDKRYSVKQFNVLQYYRTSWIRPPPVKPDNRSMYLMCSFRVFLKSNAISRSL